MSKVANKKHLSKLNDALNDFSVFVVIKFFGVSDFRAKALRADLRSTESKLIVLKNTVSKIAFTSLNLDCEDKLADSLKGSVALICSNDICSISKKIHSSIIEGFNEKIEPLLCIYDRKYISRDSLEMISTLPSAEIIKIGIAKMLVSRSVLLPKLLMSGSNSIFRLLGYKAKADCS